MLKALAITLLLTICPAGLALAHGNPTECIVVWESTSFINLSQGPLNSIWLAPIRSYVQDFWCETDPAGTSITINPEVSGSKLLTAPLVCSSPGAYGTINTATNEVLRGQTIDLDWSDLVGQPHRLTVCFEHTITGAL